MITIFLFVVFLLRITYLHMHQPKRSRGFNVKDFATPIILVLLILVPLLVANFFPSQPRSLSREEIIEKHQGSYDSESKLEAYTSILELYPEDLDFRFRFIDEAVDFDFAANNIDTLKSFQFSPNSKIQRQSLAYLYASRFPNDSAFIAPLENAPRYNYIKGTRAAKRGKFKVASQFLWKELAVNHSYKRATNKLLRLAGKQLDDTYVKLTQNEDFIEHLPLVQQRYLHYKFGRWGYYMYDIVRGIFEMPMFIALFAGLVISLVWMLFLRNLDIFHKEKWRDLIIVFLLGAFFTQFCLIGYDYARYSLDFYITGEAFNDFLYCAGVIGVSEEIVKLIPWISFIFLIKRAKEPYDYLLYASVSALGFAFVENLHYLENPGNISLRSIMSTVGHMFDASLVAYGFILGRYKAKNLAMKIVYPVLGIIAACLAHGFYDFWLISPGFQNYSILTFIFFALTTAVWFQFINNAMNNSPYYVGRRYEPLKQINIISIGLILVMAVEYLILNYDHGTEYANAKMIGANWMVPVFLSFITVLLLQFEVVKGRWRKFKFRIPNWLPIFNGGNGHSGQSDIELESYLGLDLRFFVSKSNRYVGSKFPIRAICIELISVSGSSDWCLFQITSEFDYAGHSNKYIIVRSKDTQIPLNEDKVEVLLLFVPHSVQLDGSYIDTKDLHFTGQAFARPV